MSVDYEPLPRNTFMFKINDADVYILPKEEVVFDPNKIETIEVADFKVNDKSILSG